MDFQALVNFVNASKTEELKSAFSGNKTLVDSYDENGMTLLQHASYNGNLKMVKFLLREGASVNHYKQKEGYTALMFASLMGHIAIVQTLLEAGARHQDTNKVNRTAAEMAGFVGKHMVVSVLNNYIELRVLKKYSKPNGVENHVRLPEGNVKVLSSLLNDFTFTPVNIFKQLSANYQKEGDVSLLHIAPQIASEVIEDLMNSYFTSNNMNETIALKLHFISATLKYAHENINLELKKESAFYPLHGVTRKFLGEPRLAEDRFLVDAFKSYKFTDSTLWQGIARHIASVMSEEKSAPYKKIIVKHINCTSPAFAEDQTSICATCDTYEEVEAPTTKMKACSVCKKTKYCSKECQVMHWPIHKKTCKPEEPKSEEKNAE